MISFSFLLLAGLVLTEALPFPGDRGKIVGGEEVDIKDFPHQVSFQVQGGHVCGGSIIAPNRVLTAAHCTNIFQVEDITFRAGSKNRYDGGQVVQAVKIVQHEDYNSAKTDVDFSLVQVTPAFNLGSEGIEAIRVTDYEPPEGTNTIVTGWGALSSGGGSPDLLMGVNVTIVHRDTCNEKYGQGRITESMICAADLGKDSCQGDSGGPLIDPYRKIQVGVVSWGYGCADPQYPGVYSNVAAQREWIRANTGV